MLTLTRKPGQEILIGDDIRVIIKEVRGSQVRLGFVAPPSVTISRGEVTPEAQPATPGVPAKPARLKPLASADPGPARPLPPPPGVPGTGAGKACLVTLENLFLPDSPVGRATAAARDRLIARPPRISRGSRRPPRLI